jgi:fatty-acyl-CoA synthase
VWINVTTIGDLLDQRADDSPCRNALVMPDVRLTYAQLSSASDRLAAALLDFGIGRGDKVGILMPNSHVYVEALFAIAKLGAIVVPINARLKAEELRYVIVHSDIDMLLVASDAAGENATAMLNTIFPDLPQGHPRALSLSGAPRLRNIVNFSHDAPGFITRDAFDAVSAAVTTDAVKTLQQRVRIRDIALLMYTSGTTSNPKGCLLTHEALVRQGRAVAQTRFLLTEDDAMWNPLPMFHCGGIVPLLGVISVGATFCHPGHFEPTKALQMIADERCTVLYPAFETIWRDVLNHPDFDQYDLSAVRLILNVATPRVLAEFEARTPEAKQVSSYGSTEGATNLAVAHPDDPYDARINTVGKPVDGMEVKIVDPETGAELPVGVMGELCFRGYAQFEAYYKEEALTAENVDPQGWFHSGDRAMLDAEGNVVYGGRFKDMLKVGGENVAAVEVEDYLVQHPAVSVVQVVAAPDSRYVEVPAAFIQLVDGAQLTEDELIEFCRGKLASYKVPRHVRFVTDWPMSGTKIKKIDLRARIADELSKTTA